MLKLDENRVNYRNFTRNYVEEQLVLTLGGRAAEMILSNEYDVSTFGPDRLSNTRAISKLLADAAMSTCRSFGSFYVGCYVMGPETHEQIARKYPIRCVDEIDDCRKDMVTEGTLIAKRILSRNINALNELVCYLLKYKSLSGAELRLLLNKTANTNDLLVEKNRGNFRL